MDLLFTRILPDGREKRCIINMDVYMFAQPDEVTKGTVISFGEGNFITVKESFDTVCQAMREAS